MEDKNKLYQSDKPSNTIYDKALEYIDLKYSIRFNSIGLDYEIALKNQENWSILNLNSLIIELTKAGIEIPVSNQTGLKITIQLKIILNSFRSGMRKPIT